MSEYANLTRVFFFFPNVIALSELISRQALSHDSSSKTQNNTQISATILSAASWHPLYLAGLFPPATSSSSSLRLVSPLALAAVDPPVPCWASPITGRRPSGPLIQPTSHQQLSVIARLIRRRTGGRQSVTDVFCATKNELPGDQGRWRSGRLSMKGL